MSKKFTQQEIINKFISIHGDKYDYSKFIYNNIDEKSTIICRVHGEFLMSAYKHLHRKQGCKKCNNVNKNNLTQKEFLKRCSIKHDNFYDYSKVKYYNSKSLIEIICPIHGSFFQNSRTHLNGSGCSACIDNRNIKSSKSLFNILSKEYEYPLIDKEFKKLTSKITVYCKKHNKTSIKSIQKLLHKNSYCNECSKEKTLYSGYKLKTWLNYCNSKSIKVAYVYLIKLFNENEEFYKIGLTSKKDLNCRYNSNFLMPYNYKIIDIKEYSPEEAYKKEKELLRLNKIKSNCYKPLINFRGKYETFKNIIIWN